jgi:hypothetical protein
MRLRDLGTGLNSCEKNADRLLALRTPRLGTCKGDCQPRMVSQVTQP